MSLKKISLLFTVSLLTIVTLPAHAQDLLAKQAPVDRRMKMVDTLALRPAMENEEARLTANALYEDWNNT